MDSFFPSCSVKMTKESIGSLIGLSRPLSSVLGSGSGGYNEGERIMTNECKHEDTIRLSLTPDEHFCFDCETIITKVKKK